MVTYKASVASSSKRHSCMIKTLQVVQTIMQKVQYIKMKQTAVSAT